MEEAETEEPPSSSKSSSKIVFINDIDSYASRCIAKFLSKCDAETEKEERGTSARSPAFLLVATARGRRNQHRPYMLEVYEPMNTEEHLMKLMDCDVIIYNITQHADQVEEAFWAISALHKEMDHFSGPKMFILISTVMTWARSKPINPEDPELPFTDDVFWRRRAHPNFQSQIDLEKRVVKMGKTNRTQFSTYVLASGLQYGMGEQILHYFFKTSWQGEEPEIPVFGEGNNIVPMIHICDLASVIQNVIERQPTPHYLLAVDASSNTMEAIVMAISSALGPGKILKKPFEEVFLVENLSPLEIDSLKVNLYMEAVHIKELFLFDWLCESGLVENIELVVEEYRQNWGLLSMRVCVIGPPAVGKSTVAKQIIEHYKLHYVNVENTISETISELEDTVKNADPDEEDGESVEEAKKLLSSLKESREPNAGPLDDHLLVKVMKDKLMSKPCRNQGYVLDNFPTTYEQAKELFFGEEQESQEGTLPHPTYRRTIPEIVLCLDASDEFLKDRVINLPEEVVQERNYQQDHFLQEMANYRERHAGDESVINYFDELEITIVHMEINNNDIDCQMVMPKMIDVLGQPRNYGPSRQDLLDEKRRKAEARMKLQAQVKAEEELKEAEEAINRATSWDAWLKKLVKVKQEEEELLEEQSLVMRNYLMTHVMPTLTRGLMDCCTVQPEDPVDFLAEYLIRNNPFNHFK